ncbi:MAG TPA: SIS domain-containing protein [Patescibacteria group bacterium]|nr:SIS domain-containing protein [Patescibacteria group bacterium]
MDTSTPFSLPREMLETPGILRNFDGGAAAGWAEAIGERLLLTGEGSSRLFPAGNMVEQALRRGHKWRLHSEGARQAAEYDLGGFAVLAASNSGRTREVIALLERLKDHAQPVYGITANGDSPLAGLVSDLVTLECGPENAVAATKSVMEMALVFQSLLGGDEWSRQGEAGSAAENVLRQDIEHDVIKIAAAAPVIYFAGRNNGVAAELTLKANEIARKKSDYLEGTYALHGIEETMRAEELVVLIEPFADEIEKYQAVLKKGVGIQVIAIANKPQPFPTITVPSVAGFDNYLQLMAGWNLLVAIGLANGVNIDKPERVRKVGNAI